MTGKSFVCASRAPGLAHPHSGTQQSAHHHLSRGPRWPPHALKTLVSLSNSTPAQLCSLARSSPPTPRPRVLFLSPHLPQPAASTSPPLFPSALSPLVRRATGFLQGCRKQLLVSTHGTGPSLTCLVLSPVCLNYLSCGSIIIVLPKFAAVRFDIACSGLADRWLLNSRGAVRQSWQGNEALNFAFSHSTVLEFGGRNPVCCVRSSGLVSSGRKGLRQSKGAVFKRTTRRVKSERKAEEHVLLYGARFREIFFLRFCLLLKVLRLFCGWREHERSRD